MIENLRDMQFFDFSRMIPSGEMPGIPLFAHFLPLYQKAEELGMVSLVNSTALSSGIGITVKKILADLSSTTIFYEMDPEHGAWHAGSATLKDSMGREIPLRGEAQGLLEFFPVEDGATSLTLHVTECYKTTPGFFRIIVPLLSLKDRDGAMPPDVEEKWNLWLVETARQTEERMHLNPVLMQSLVKGSWEFTFPIDLGPRAAGTFTREINRTFSFGAIELFVKRLRAGVIHWLLEYEIHDPERERLWKEWRRRQWEHIRRCASREEYLEIQRREFAEENFVLANFDFALLAPDADETVTGGIFVRDGARGWFTFKPPPEADRLVLQVRRLIEYNPPGGVAIPLEEDAPATRRSFTLPILEGEKLIAVRDVRFTTFEARKDVFSLDVMFLDPEATSQETERLPLEVRSAALEYGDDESLALSRTRQSDDGHRRLEFDTMHRPPRTTRLQISSFDLDLEPPLEMEIETPKP